MQIFKTIKTLGIICAVSGSILTGTAGLNAGYALEDIPGINSYESAREAYRQGITAYDEEWYDLAFPALKYAAERKIIGAQLTVAKMYAQGIWVRQSHKKAFDIYNEIRQDNLKVVTAYPRPKGAGLVAEAYVELAKYYNSGVAGSDVALDHREAFDLFMVAANSLGSAEAQYELAKMYISGRGGVDRSTRKAIRWLINADKNYNYPPAQALLGRIFWYGQDGQRKRPIFALALLIKAKKNAGRSDERWINALYKKANRNASAIQRDKSRRLVRRWQAKELQRKERNDKIKKRYLPRRGQIRDIWQPREVQGRQGGLNMTGSNQSQILGLGQFQNIDTPVGSGDD